MCDRGGCRLPRNFVRTAVVLVAIIFGTEWAIMLVFSLTDARMRMPGWLYDSSDAILLSFVAGILVYFTVVIPQQRVLKYTQRINRLLHFLSRINQDSQGQCDSRALFDHACATAVKCGGFRFAWIGMLGVDSGHLDVVAMDGDNEGCMQAVRAVENESAPRCGIAVRVLAQGKPAYCQMLAAGDCAAAWREMLLRYGCRSCAAFPLRRDDSVVGVFAVYAGDSGFFHDDELHILEEVAGDISFALTSSEQARAREQTAQILRARVDELERFQKATVDREFRIKELRDGKYSARPFY